MNEADGKGRGEEENEDEEEDDGEEAEEEEDHNDQRRQSDEGGPRPGVEMEAEEDKQQQQLASSSSPDRNGWRGGEGNNNNNNRWRGNNFRGNFNGRGSRRFRPSPSPDLRKNPGGGFGRGGHPYRRAHSYYEAGFYDRPPPPPHHHSSRNNLNNGYGGCYDRVPGGGCFEYERAAGGGGYPRPNFSNRNGGYDRYDRPYYDKFHGNNKENCGGGPPPQASLESRRGRGGWRQFGRWNSFPRGDKGGGGCGHSFGGPAAPHGQVGPSCCAKGTVSGGRSTPTEDGASTMSGGSDGATKQPVHTVLIDNDGERENIFQGEPGNPPLAGVVMQQAYPGGPMVTIPVQWSPFIDPNLVPGDTALTPLVPVFTHVLDSSQISIDPNQVLPTQVDANGCPVQVQVKVDSNGLPVEIEPPMLAINVSSMQQQYADMSASVAGADCDESILMDEGGANRASDSGEGAGGGGSKRGKSRKEKQAEKIESEVDIEAENARLDKLMQEYCASEDVVELETTTTTTPEENHPPSSSSSSTDVEVVSESRVEGSEDGKEESSSTCDNEDSSSSSNDDSILKENSTKDILDSGPVLDSNYLVDASASIKEAKCHQIDDDDDSAQMVADEEKSTTIGDMVDDDSPSMVEAMDVVDSPPTTTKEDDITEKECSTTETTTATITTLREQSPPKPEEATDEEIPLQEEEQEVAMDVDNVETCKESTEESSTEEEKVAATESEAEVHTEAPKIIEKDLTEVTTATKTTEEEEEVEGEEEEADVTCGDDSKVADSPAEDSTNPSPKEDDSTKERKEENKENKENYESSDTNDSQYHSLSDSSSPTSPPAETVERGYVVVPILTPYYDPAVLYGYQQQVVYEASSDPSQVPPTPPQEAPLQQQTSHSKKKKKKYARRRHTDTSLGLDPELYTGEPFVATPSGYVSAGSVLGQAYQGQHVCQVHGPQLLPSQYLPEEGGLPLVATVGSPAELLVLPFDAAAANCQAEAASASSAAGADTSFANLHDQERREIEVVLKDKVTKSSSSDSGVSESDEPCDRSSSSGGGGRLQQTKSKSNSKSGGHSRKVAACPDVIIDHFSRSRSRTKSPKVDFGKSDQQHHHQQPSLRNKKGKNSRSSKSGTPEVEGKKAKLRREYSGDAGSTSSSTPSPQIDTSVSAAALRDQPVKEETAASAASSIAAADCNQKASSKLNENSSNKKTTEKTSDRGVRSGSENKEEAAEETALVSAAHQLETGLVNESSCSNSSSENVQERLQPELESVTPSCVPDKSENVIENQQDDCYKATKNAAGEAAESSTGDNKVVIESSSVATTAIATPTVSKTELVKGPEKSSVEEESECSQTLQAQRSYAAVVALKGEEKASSSEEEPKLNKDCLKDLGVTEAVKRWIREVTPEKAFTLPTHVQKRLEVEELDEGDEEDYSSDSENVVDKVSSTEMQTTKNGLRNPFTAASSEHPLTEDRSSKRVATRNSQLRETTPDTIDEYDGASTVSGLSQGRLYSESSVSLPVSATDSFDMDDEFAEPAGHSRYLKDPNLCEPKTCSKYYQLGVDVDDDQTTPVPSCENQRSSCNTTPDTLRISEDPSECGSEDVETEVERQARKEQLSPVDCEPVSLATEILKAEKALSNMTHIIGDEIVKESKRYGNPDVYMRHYGHPRPRCDSGVLSEDSGDENDVVLRTKILRNLSSTDDCSSGVCSLGSSPQVTPQSTPGRTRIERGAAAQIGAFPRQRPRLQPNPLLVLTNGETFPPFMSSSCCSIM